MLEIPPGRLFLGEAVDGDHQRTGEQVLVKASDLTTHGVIVGMTGSGKTGLGVDLVEETLLSGVPTLVLDPKGDLGNLLLTFPSFAPEQFAPWVEGGDAAQVAGTWKEGLASWGIDGARVQALADAATFTIYTPGSSAGVGLNVVGSLRRPPEGTDLETVTDEVEGFVSGLLGLVGIVADPLSSREHILLANLVHDAWNQGQDLDLAGLVGRVVTPPIRKLGVFDLDEFFPPGDRMKLAMQLNGLLASPAFAAWGQGDDLDLDTILRPGGRPACAVVSLAHLSDDERQFVVTLVLSKLVTWMRRQPGTDTLRALVYFDEVLGFVPPSAKPPAKGPILTLFKQARAFGVGVVLATQNPVDVDYKALSNAGTWMVGRLQTEQDKARLLDGMSAAAGGVDVAAVGETISGLAKREFVLRQAGSDAPRSFTTRWAMSYLRGPLTREQIATLMAARKAAAPTAPTPTPPTPTAPAAPAANPTPTPDPHSVPARADATPVMPGVADGIAVRWLDPAAPWATQVGASPTGTALSAGIVATAELRFDNARAGLDETETFECVLHPLTDPPDVAALTAVDHDARDFREEPPPAATYVLPDAKVRNKGYFTGLQKELTEHLRATRTVDLFVNRTLKLTSRPGEVEAAFVARCDAAADLEADKAAAALTRRYEERIRRARDQLAAAEDRADQAREAKENRSRDELLSGAGDLLGAVLGGRGGLRSVFSKVGTASRRHGRTGEADRRAETARSRVEEKEQVVADLEAELTDQLAAIAGDWDAKAVAVEPLTVSLDRSDVRITQLQLVWMPVD